MFDLYTELQTSPEFVNKLQKLTTALQKLDYDLGDAAPYNSRTSEIIYDIFKLCQYNVGMLVPYFFPTALKGQPLSLLNRPFAFCLTEMNVGGETTIRASRQIAKCVKSTTLVKIRHKVTGEVVEITAQEAFELFEALDKTRGE